MTRQQALELSTVMKAWGEGKQIKIRRKSTDKWTNIHLANDDIYFDDENFEYQIAE